ncbi:VOC family protein [Dethiothermospora halolimnae]|uniref:VOC family protein n=1 Tax=Dethiothermospora halolimnae TaxID=3114390 RepID=UPI003CCBCCD2
MKVNHIGYAVYNIEDSIEEFKELGYIENERSVVDKNRDIIIQFMKNGDYMVELIAPVSEESPITNILKKSGPSPYHICYESNNLENDIANLKSKGFIIISSSKEAIAFNYRKVVFLYNKNVGVIELVENN